MSKYLIAPSIVAADHLKLGEDITTCETAGADWIHVDVMDGHFVPNLTMGPFLVQTYKRATRLPLDVHLMIEQPERTLEAFANAGASHLIVHVETCPHLWQTMQEIKRLGCLAGVTLNPGTPLSAIEPVLSLADLVLVMSVNPGYSNQQLLPESFNRITHVRKMLDDMGSSAYLEVDGGITPENIVQLRNAGGNVFVSAHAVFNHPQGISAGIADLRRALDSAPDKRARTV